MALAVASRVVHVVALLVAISAFGLMEKILAGRPNHALVCRELDSGWVR